MFNEVARAVFRQTGTRENAGVRALADGGFLVSRNDVDADLVRAQRFDAAGNKVGIEFPRKNGVGGRPEAALLLERRIAYAIDDLSSGDCDIVTSIWTLNAPPSITSDGGGATAMSSVAENATAVTTAAATDVDS